MGEEAAIAMAEAQQRYVAALAAQQSQSWWLLLDPMVWLPFVMIFAMVLFFTRSGPFKRQNDFLDHQRSYLDHQRTVNAQALEHTSNFEKMVTEQYRETNAHAERALALSERAIELHSAALAELARLNATLAQMSRPTAPEPGDPSR